MEQKTKILIVDDNAQIRSCLRGIFEGNDQLIVIGEAVDGVEALERIERDKPDVVLLDIVMPNLDGFGVLEAMKERADAPLFIMVSALSREGFVLRAIEMGATYFIAKPFDAASVRNRIRDCVAIKSGKVSESATVSRIGMRSLEKTVDEKLSTMFITIGIPAHIKGYSYLREAVKMVMEDPNVINSITKELYPGIARTFQTSASKVERAIRHAIEVAWTRGKIENINEIFGYNVYSRNDKPTNGEFIALLADKLNLEKAA
ncbi:MAG: sporulation transcription factor Spo0A [Clostridia bacterium]|nr:sporulation transcription factor Spo0A [Clostridia bacterium]